MQLKYNKVFNKETEYALRGLVYVQSQNLKGRRPGIVEIAHGIEAPPFYAAKILQRLVKQGFLNSQKGKGGGFYFKEGKADIMLKELITATEGSHLFYGCGFGLKQCDENNPCPLHHKYAPVRDGLLKLVSEETIHSLASNLSK